MDVIDRFGPARLWVATLVASIVGLAGGSLLAPRVVYDGFIWRYFWGPVAADAHNARCAINDGHSVVYKTTAAACQAASKGTYVATPGYTAVSEVGYMIVGLFFLLGVLLLLRRLHLGRSRKLFFGLVPFMLFGGALRVVEDANNYLAAHGGTELLSYPVNTIFISPVIYFTVFFIALGALLVSVTLSRRDYVESYPRTLGAIGTVAFVLTFAGLIIASVMNDSMGFYPLFFVVTVALASAIAYGLYRLADVLNPEINRGTGYIGLVVLWAHAIDGVANVLASDWWWVFNLPFKYVPKHPANAAIISMTKSVFPATVTDVIGTSWPFLLVKMAVALTIVWLFSEEFVDESPRYAIVLLMAIAAVGLGPGTRDMIRATFGI
ncbi:MAG: DUF63 family protein [Halapricum sp.]